MTRHKHANDICHVSYSSLEEACNMAFGVLVFGELFRTLTARNPELIFWEVGAFTNLRLLGTVILSLFLQIALHHIPLTQSLPQISALSFQDYLFMLFWG